MLVRRSLGLVPSSALVVVMVLFGGLLTGPAGAARHAFVRVQVDTANLRGGPGTEFEHVRHTYENEPLQVVRRRETWLEVRDFQGRSGWIYAPLTDGRSTVVVTARLVNVRSGPGTDRPVVFTAERGVNFLVLREQGGWLEVQHEDGDRGWVHGALVWGDK